MQRRKAAHTLSYSVKGIEVLLLSDRIDEWMMNYLSEFDGKQFQSVSKADESLDKLADENKAEQEEADKTIRAIC